MCRDTARLDRRPCGRLHRVEHGDYLVCLPDAFCPRDTLCPSFQVLDCNSARCLVPAGRWPEAGSLTRRADYEGVRVTLLGQLGKARVPSQVDIGFGDGVTRDPPRRSIRPCWICQGPNFSRIGRGLNPIVAKDARRSVFLFYRFLRANVLIKAEKVIRIVL